MDQQLLHNVLHYVLLLLLLQALWGRVLAAPLPDQGRPGACHLALESATSLTRVLQHDASQLLEVYERVYDFRGDAIPDEVPGAAVSGSSPAERLAGIAAKDALFRWHLGAVEQDTTYWGAPDPALQQSLAAVRTRLSHHSRTVGDLLKAVDPLFVPPPTPTPPEIHNEHGFAKKSYGWALLSSLEAHVANVLLEMVANTTVCGTDVENLLSA